MKIDTEAQSVLQDLYHWAGKARTCNQSVIRMKTRLVLNISTNLWKSFQWVILTHCGTYNNRKVTLIGINRKSL